MKNQGQFNFISLKINILKVYYFSKKVVISHQ